jgi:anti-anti-sigma regulatory factor
MPHNNLRAARGLPFVWQLSPSISMLRIVRSIGAGTTTLTVSGRIGSDLLPELRRSVEAERTRGVVLDLVEVSLVDVETVRFLVQCETEGVRIAGCPAYVREWMTREKWPL